MWRQYWDVQDSWQNVLNIIDFYGNNAGDFANFSGPGGFSDPDEVSGFYGFVVSKCKTVVLNLFVPEGHTGYDI